MQAAHAIATTHAPLGLGALGALPILLLFHPRHLEHAAGNCGVERAVSMMTGTDYSAVPPPTAGGTVSRVHGRYRAGWRVAAWRGRTGMQVACQEVCTYTRGAASIARLLDYTTVNSANLLVILCCLHYHLASHLRSS